MEKISEYPPVPSNEEIEKAFGEAKKEKAFWDHRYAHFLKKYPDEFVAIRNNRELAHDPTLSGLVEQIKAKKVLPKETWIRYITDKPPYLH